MGEICALVAAAVWSLAVVLFKRGGEVVPPVSLNLFKTILSLLLFAGTVALLGEPLLPDRPLGDYLRLAASGVIGITVSDTLLFFSLNRLGAGFVGIVECLYSPLVILVAFVFLGEHLAPWDALGLAMILSGILVVAGRPRSAAPIHRASLLAGILYGVLAMLSLAVAVVLMKPVVEETPAFWANLVRIASAAVSLAAVATFLPGRRRVWECFRPSKIWTWIVPASILGTYVSLLFWVLGFKYTLASRAAILNQSHTVFVLLLAWLVLGERITRRKMVAIGLGLGGVAVVTLT